MPGIQLRFFLLGAVAAVLSCSDGTTNPEDRSPDQITLPGLIVSEAIQNSAGGVLGVAGATEVSWVSLPPGTLTGIESVRIRNATGGGAATEAIPVLDGGFDPVPVVAREGDELELTFTGTDGHVSVTYDRVPRRRPPVFVRASPPHGRSDVALSVRPTIVFSEPIDPRSLTPSSVRLLANGVPVNGTPERLLAEPWVVQYVPSAPLEPETVYVLVATQDVRDLQGDALAAAVAVSFTTAVAGPAPLVDPVIAFVSDRDGSPHIYVANSDGSGITRLASGEAPSWSRDGRRIAFHRSGSPGNAAGIYIMNRHGGDLTLLASGYYPAWSPDGSKIAFNGPVGDDVVFVVGANGGVPAKLIDYDFALPDDGYGPGWVGLASWSPDGQSIAFVRGNYGIPWDIYIMNADGSSPRLLSTDGWGKSTVPAWSPDGSRIAVFTHDWAGGSPESVIGAYDVRSGGRVIPYRSTSRYIGRQDWSPDGDSLVFDQFASADPGRSPFGSRMRIFVLTVETGAVRQLIPDARASEDYWDYDVVWSRVPRPASGNRP